MAVLSLKALGEDPSWPLPSFSMLPVILGVPCLGAVTPVSASIFPLLLLCVCVCVCVSKSPLRRTAVIELGSTLFQCDLILT